MEADFVNAFSMVPLDDRVGLLRRVTHGLTEAPGRELVSDIMTSALPNSSGMRPEDVPAVLATIGVTSQQAVEHITRLYTDVLNGGPLAPLKDYLDSTMATRWMEDPFVDAVRAFFVKACVQKKFNTL